MNVKFSKRMILVTIIMMDLLMVEFDFLFLAFQSLQSFWFITSWVAVSLSINFSGCLSLFILGDLSDRYGASQSF